MTTVEYVYCTDKELKDDFEAHIFQNAFDEFARHLPTEPESHGRKNPVWFDGYEILCESSDMAETIANMLDYITGECESHTGYYNPEEDALEPNGPFKTTGWYYVDFD